MEPRVLKLEDSTPDFDGSLQLVLTDSSGTVRHDILIDDVEALNNNILKTLNPDEQSGLPFIRAVRRYMFTVHGVEMSVQAASRLYAEIRRIVEDGKRFFMTLPVSADSTESPP